MKGTNAYYLPHCQLLFGLLVVLYYKREILRELLCTSYLYLYLYECSCAYFYKYFFPIKSSLVVSC